MSDPKHSNPNPQPKPNKPEDNNLGFCADGLYLQGRAPGCRLRRELSADTLSHILHEDNLLWLGIPLAPHRASKRDPQSNVQALQKKLSDLSTSFLLHRERIDM